MTERVAPSAAEIVASVAPEEYARLLGLPRGQPLTGVVAERADAARRWYADHGRPWLATRRLAVEALEGRVPTRRTDSHAIVAFVVTAGGAVEVESRRLWQAGRPDESFFLERLAAAVTEQLGRWAALHVCRRAGESGETAVFNGSPGCAGWAIEDQEWLMNLLFDGSARAEAPVRLLPSGMLSPVHSQAGVLGLTARAPLGTPADACRECDLAGCGFRRGPFQGAA